MSRNFSIKSFFANVILSLSKDVRKALMATQCFDKLSMTALLFSLLLVSCSHKTGEDTVINESGTPVQVTTITKKIITDTLALYGTLLYVKKTPLLSPIGGFIQSVNTVAGEMPETGKVLFTIKTKEAAAYPDFIADTLFKNSVITVRAAHSYRIDSVLKQSGDFVQEGEVLCQTVDRLSMVAVLHFPFEKSDVVKAGASCRVSFPGKKVYNATVSKILPEADISSQTQQAYVRINSDQTFPEFLNVQVNFILASPKESYVLPKSAILTNETMNEYWVMKLINDSTAVKEDVTIGRKTKSEVEILDPAFSPDNRILVSGNYGLEDTAKVMITK